jgi:hypothetical protein
VLGRIPRRTIAVVFTAAAVLIPVSPALAHYCYKDFKSESAATKAAKTTSWMTADEFWSLIEADAEGIPQCALDAAEEWFGDQPDTRLFKGPGLLAGGTEGTDRTPSGMGYTPFDSFFADCPPPEEGV